MTAGSETGSSLVAYCILFLCLHPDWQEALHRELDEVLGACGERLPTIDDKHRFGGAPCKGGGGCYTYTHEWQTSATLTAMTQNRWEIHVGPLFSWCPLLSDVQAVRVTQLLYQRLFHCFSRVINELWFSFFFENLKSGVTKNAIY